MIIQCEKCQTKFNLDETLLKEEGSKVRCSHCREIFVVYPKEETALFEQEFVGLNDEGLELDEDLVEEIEEPMKRDEIEESKEAEGIDFGNEKDINDPSADEETVETVLLEDLSDLEEEEGAGPEIAEVVPIRKIKSSKPRLLPVILIIFSLLVGGFAVLVFFYPDRIHEYLPFLEAPEKLEITDMGVRRLSFKAVTGSFTNSKEGGRLFVIQGLVKNEYPKSRSFILIKGAIFDNIGQEVKKKQVYAGNIFNEVEIKELPLAQINKAMEDPNGMGMKNIDVSPDASIPFMIVFENLPENLSEFTVEAISSSEAS